MILRKIVVLLMLLLIGATSCTWAQKDDVSFLIQTIKESYAGYKDKAKGESFDKYAGQVLKEYETDTFRILSLLTGYFKDLHLQVFRNGDLKSEDSLLLKDKLADVTSYLDNHNIRKHSYEGYWLNDYGSCVIALKKVDEKTWQYEARIVEVRKQRLPEGMLYARFEPMDNGLYRTEYMEQIYQQSEFRSDSLFTLGIYGKWKKLKNYNAPILKNAPAYNHLARSLQLDSQTYLITLPENTEENTVIMDSLVKAEYDKIGSSKNLIIDIRNNSGGTVRAYGSLFPFVYTNPIQRINGTCYYSAALLKAEEENLKYNKEHYPENTKLIKLKEAFVEEIRSKQGKVLYEPDSLICYDSIKRYPQNIAIIMNYACVSAAEMMLLDFKQSSKVITFGEHTNGTVDYLNNFSMDLPSKKYLLVIASVKREIPAGQAPLDNKGIYPDVPIPDREIDWVAFVRRYFAYGK